MVLIPTVMFFPFHLDLKKLSDRNRTVLGFRIQWYIFRGLFKRMLIIYSLQDQHREKDSERISWCSLKESYIK